MIMNKFVIAGMLLATGLVQAGNPVEKAYGVESPPFPPSPIPSTAPASASPQKQFPSSKLRGKHRLFPTKWNV